MFNKIVSTLSIVTVVAILFSAIGCGNNWRITAKNMMSNYDELPRHVLVYDSMSKKTLWDYTGPVYARVYKERPGNFTILYKKNGKLFKNDYIGNHLNLILEEVDNATGNAR